MGCLDESLAQRPDEDVVLAAVVVEVGSEDAGVVGVGIVIGLLGIAGVPVRSALGHGHRFIPQNPSPTAAIKSNVMGTNLKCKCTPCFHHLTLYIL